MRPYPFRHLIVFVAAIISPPAVASTLSPGDLLIVDDPLGTLAPTRLIRFDPATGAHDVISSGGHMTSIDSISLDSRGRILAVDSFAGIIRINPATGAQTVLSANFEAEGFQFPRDVLELPSGDLLVTTSNRHILQVNGKTGAKTILAHMPVSVRDVARDGDGFLITSPSISTPALIRVDPTTWTHTVVSGGGLIFSPIDLALTESGYAYIPDSTGILIGVDPVTGAQVSASAGGPLIDLSAVTIGGNGRPIVTTRSGQIFEIDPDNFGEQIPLTAPGENLGRLVEISYISVVPAPGAGTTLLITLIVSASRSRRNEES